MRILFITILCWLSYTVSGQKIIPEVLATSGDVYDNGNISLQWTLGELLVDQKSSSSVSMSEGFHQLFIDDMSTAVANITIDATVQIFPNPAIDRLNVLIGNEKSYQYTIIGLDGKMHSSGVVSREKILDISPLSFGGYFLEIKNGDRERGVYFFVKS